jgi:hypothetical protein
VLEKIAHKAIPLLAMPFDRKATRDYLRLSAPVVCRI